MELEECIKDAFDDSLKEYTQSEEYIKQQQHITDMLTIFRARLDNKQMQEFNILLDEIGSFNGRLASEAYLHGVVEGIALHIKVVTK